MFYRFVYDLCYFLQSYNTAGVPDLTTNLVFNSEKWREKK